MDALTFTDASAFAERVGPVIDRHPAAASLLATNLDQTIHGPGLETQWFLIQDDGQPVGAAMHTAIHGLFLTPVPDADAGMFALAEALQQAGVAPSGVTGPVEAIGPFVDIWGRWTGAIHRVTTSTRLYEIRSPPEPPAVGGAARLATEADLVQAIAWAREFDVEAEPGLTRADPELTVRRRLARGRLLFWETEDGPVSMAGVSRAIAGVARIGAVYTPKHLRRNGFGAAVTVAATRQGFDDGADRCVLYADLANPTSNGIYLAIGYRPVGDSATVAFEPGPS